MATTAATGILVCIPAYGGMMYHGCTVSLLHLERACNARGIPIGYQFMANESLITRARNQLVHSFLGSQNSHLLFIDADIQFDSEDILRMYDANLPLIGGLYPKKHRSAKMDFERDYAMTPLDNKTPMLTTDFINKPFQVRYVGTGMMLIQRQVFDTMIAAGIKTYKLGAETQYAFFDTSIAENDNSYLSEDYYFCENWRKLGGAVYVALWTHCIHWGTHGYTGSPT